MKELGVFCGTFNPIHWGHLLAAECARDQFRLDKVMFVTCGLPPHRRQDLLDGESRHEMVAAAIADNHLFEASRLELDRPGPSYTVDTMLELRAANPAARLSLIIGGDNLRYLPQWHRADELLRLCRFLVAPRMVPEPRHGEGSCIEPSASLPAEFDGSEIEFPVVSVSSSEIRARLRAERSVLYMVPTSVNSILIARGHYKESPSPSRDSAT